MMSFLFLTSTPICLSKPNAPKDRKSCTKRTQCPDTKNESIQDDLESSLFTQELIITVTTATVKEYFSPVSLYTITDHNTCEVLMNGSELLKILIFGIIEGITEWLPVSSTGHLILLEHIFPLKESAAFQNLFQVLVQLGAVLAVAVRYWDHLFPWSFSTDTKKTVLQPDILKLWGKIFLASIPAGAAGILWDDVFTRLFYNERTVAIMLILVGILFLLIERKKRPARITTLSEISCGAALWIGLFQMLAAIFPGTSRSGATIIGALFFGISRTAATEFTFFLAIPAMAGGSLIRLFKSSMAFSASEVILLLMGMLSAYVTSMVAIHFLLSYVKQHDFRIFGWYRILLGCLVLLTFGWWLA